MHALEKIIKFAHENKIYDPMNPISDKIAWQLDYYDVVNFALVQNKMQICDSCTIENQSERELTNLVLRLEGEYL